MSDRELFTMAMRLRKCRRCGHYPCPCCEEWCDILPGYDRGMSLIPPVGMDVRPKVWEAIVALVEAVPADNEEASQCPCSDENRCVFTAKDLDHNRMIFRDIEKICEAYGLNADGFTTVEDEYGAHVIVRGEPKKSAPTDEAADKIFAAEAKLVIGEAIKGVVAGVRQWSDDDRLELMAALRGAYCGECGQTQPGGGRMWCQCENDE